MIDTKLLNEFYLFLEKYEKFYSEFLSIESQKYEVITKNEYWLLDDFMKNEQVFILKSRGFETEKDHFLKRFGDKDLILKELIDLITEDELKTKFEQLYKNISEVLLNLKEANRLSNFLIELRLHKIEIGLKKLENQPELEKIYASNAQGNTQKFTSMSKKV